MSPRRAGEYRRTLLTCARFTDIIDRQSCKLTRFATETSLEQAEGGQAGNRKRIHGIQKEPRMRVPDGIHRYATMLVAAFAILTTALAGAAARHHASARGAA